MLAPSDRTPRRARLPVVVVTAVATILVATGLAGALGAGPAAGAFPGGPEPARMLVALDSHTGERAAHEAQQITGGAVKRVERTRRGELDVTVATGAREYGVELTPRFELIRVDYGG